MKAVIIGGGKIGFYLAKTLIERDYNITIIERDRDICSKLAENTNIDVICGDGTDVELLKECVDGEADVVAAVTGKDEENFVICQIVKINFNVKQTIARVSNPKNREIFNAIGVGKTVCSTEVIANLIENELSTERFKILKSLELGEMILVECQISRKSYWANKIISNIQIPEGCVIVSVIRESEIISPRGNTLIQEDDRVIIVTNVFNKEALKYSIWGDKGC